MTQTAEKVETKQDVEYVVRGADLPARVVHDPEIVEELESLTWSERAMRDVDQAFEQFKKFVQSSIRLTYAEDWVLYSTPAGQFAYLQDVGCQRIEAPWGIGFDAVDFKAFDRKEIAGDPDGNISYRCIVRGHSSVTGAMTDELGWRASGPEGLYAKAWKDAANAPAERDRIDSNVQKSSLANARGRCIRKLTGLNRVPVRILKDLGLDVAKCAGVKFQGGVGGGGGIETANSKQTYLVAAKATKDKKVAGWERVATQKIQEHIDASEVPKKTVSAAIDWLEAAAVGSVQPAEFWAKLGIDAPAPKGAAAEKPKAGEKPQDPEAAARAKNQTNCPECERTWELIGTSGHGDGCSLKAAK